jgi:glycine/betaine/sarcosine/D-proline reductase family selenoprotein B
MAEPTQETVREFADSFFYGSRSNLDMKFLRDLSPTEVGDFFEGLLQHLATTLDDGDAGRLVDHVIEWQRHAYTAHLDGKAAFAYDDVPRAAMSKPLSNARVALITSSGHFVDGADPQPLGVVDMTQEEAERRVGEFLREAPTLSDIPVDTPPSHLRVRHGGYPVTAAKSDHNVNLPLDALQALQREGMIGEVHHTARSFVGATSQLRLREGVAPEWAEILRAEQVDAVLLVPV